MSVTFEVEGVPVPQGSKNAFVAQKAGGKPRAVLFDQAPERLKTWRKRVTEQAAQQGVQFGEEVPLRVDLFFRMPRGKTVRRLFPWVAPDIDKLTRAVFDALTKSRIIFDDSRIVTSTQKKRYADNHPPGVLIRVSEEKEI